MIDYQKIIDTYYAGHDELREILMVHSTKVAERAIKICDAHPELHLDRDFIYAAAMLHDIGIIRCDAPSIHCHGTEPYICHGTIGAQMLREENLEQAARVCERHTGTGLTLKQIVERNLPLPHKDLIPETLEEQIICYADKFYSKTHPEREKTYDHACKSLTKFGEEGLIKFQQWHKLFER